MKFIAVTQRVDIFPDRGERRDALDQRWAAFLARCGFAPFPVPNEPTLVDTLWDDCDFAGLLLTGGNDLTRYGGDAPERDETERRLLARARASGTPVIGVCRGMQVIQDSFGVPLVRVDNHVATMHAIRIDDHVTDENSFHALAARESVGELAVWAQAEDGVIEGVRHAREPIVGFMWHPERYPTFREADIRRVRGMFEGAA